MDAKDVLLGHAEDLAKKAAKTGCAATRFLTPAEARRITERFTNRRDVNLTLSGGFSGAERVRGIFTNPDWGRYGQEDLFAALKISAYEELGHRDVLGSLMALGIEREVIGDILPGGYLVCLPEMAPFITQNLERIGRLPVTVATAELGALPVTEEAVQEKTDTVASLRLDALLSAAFGLSRGRAAELIEAGRVSLNHMECLQPDKTAEEGAVLSVRGMGRAKLLEIGGVSKKGRVFVKLGLYGR
ncbi:MAG: RNA-binding protein [Oscillospiraceae bacterium]|jgi:RNA-binding protein YlmH|nr:RNA-binding protein [Oscillospiraceae bacterium]